MAFIMPTDMVCGYFDSREFGDIPFSPERAVTRYEIELYLTDGFYTVSDGEQYPIRQDHIRIARPGQRCYSKLPFTTYYIKFSADGELAGIMDTLPDYFPLYHTDEVRELMKRIMQLLSNEKDRPLAVYGKFLELLDRINADAVIPQIPNADFETVATAKAFMKEHYGEPIRLSDIAASVHLSGSYFHSLFVSVSGETPHDYLSRVRLDAAKRMLWDPRLPLDEIAEKCGFGCQQYFNAVFKKQMGTTPARYRKNLQKNYLL